MPESRNYKPTAPSDTLSAELVWKLWFIISIVTLSSTGHLPRCTARLPRPLTHSDAHPLLHSSHFDSDPDTQSDLHARRFLCNSRASCSNSLRCLHNPAWVASSTAADCYNVFLYLQDRDLLRQIRERVGVAKSVDWVQKLCSVLVVDCEVVELARAMWRDYNNERRQMAQQHLPMPSITRRLMKVR